MASFWKDFWAPGGVLHGLGAVPGSLGGLLGRLGAILRPLGGILGAHGRILVPLGPSWGHLGGVLAFKNPRGPTTVAGLQGPLLRIP